MMINDKFCCYGTFKENFSRCTLCPFSSECEGYTIYLRLGSAIEEKESKEGACEGCERYPGQNKE